MMEKFAEFAFNNSLRRISFSGINPVGRALQNSGLWMNKKSKEIFISTIFNLRNKFPNSFRIETNDPLKCIYRKTHDYGNKNEIKFDGCGAAAVTFNVSVNGNMTPCALLDLPFMNISNLSIDEMIEEYQNSEIVKNILLMNLKGKCGKCNMKYQCGGCRARAYAYYNDYLATDPDCWI